MHTMHSMVMQVGFVSPENKKCPICLPILYHKQLLTLSYIMFFIATHCILILRYQHILSLLGGGFALSESMCSVYLSVAKVSFSISLCVIYDVITHYILHRRIDHTPQSNSAKRYYFIKSLHDAAILNGEGRYNIEKVETAVRYIICTMHMQCSAMMCCVQ